MLYDKQSIEIKIIRLLVLFSVCFWGGRSEKDGPIIDNSKQLKVKLMPLTEAYAKNSINTSVFRKNSICSDNHYQLASFYDAEGYVVFAIRSIDSDTWKIVKTDLESDSTDAHNGISIALDGEGYIHIAHMISMVIGCITESLRSRISLILLIYHIW